MVTPNLPAELIDIILDFIFECPRHKWSNMKKPCAQWHSPSQLPELLRLRLVNKAFRARVTPALFHHLTFKGTHRSQTLQEISRLQLANHVRVLHLEIAPKDLGGWSKRMSHSLAPVAQKMLAYLEAMPTSLSPILRRFEKVKVLHLDMTYTGMYEKRMPKNEKVGDALEALCNAVKKAHMSRLKELTLGVPYEGGFTNFFKDLEDPRYKRLMRGVSKGMRTASVRLFDHQGNFTTMSYF